MVHEGGPSPSQRNWLEFSRANSALTTRKGLPALKLIHYAYLQSFCGWDLRPYNAARETVLQAITERSPG